MNKNMLMGVEIGLIVSFLILVLFVFDTSVVSGLIYVGITAIIIIPIVLILEKKRERIAVSSSESGEEISEQPEEETTNSANVSNFEAKPKEPLAQKPTLAVKPATPPIQEPANELRVKNDQYQWRKKN